MTKDKLDMDLVETVASLLAQPAATNIDFIWFVNNRLIAKGYQIVAQQNGFRGTKLSIERIAP